MRRGARMIVRLLIRAPAFGSLLLLSVPMLQAADTTVTTTVTTTAAAAAAIASGRQIYMSVGCWQCHGTVGQGGSAGPALAPGPMPLEALRVYLRNSVRTMPAYPTTILSDAAIADIHAYLQSIPAAPRAATLPLLRGLR